MIDKTFIQDKKVKLGFTLIEIIVALFIVGIVATISIPRFLTRKPQDISVLLNNLNNITYSAVSDALRTGKIQKVTLDFRNNKIITEEKESADIPESFDFIDLTIAGSKEEISGTAYFYINREGVSQELQAIVVDNDSNTEYRLVLNPFSSRFKIV